MFRILALIAAVIFFAIAAGGWFGGTAWTDIGLACFAGSFLLADAETRWGVGRP